MADDDDKTGFRVIEGAANPELQQAERRVSWSLRDLTANLLRVTRGAGKAHEIPKQVIALVEALQEYVKHSTSLPDLGGFLTEPLRDEIDFDTESPRSAEQEIISGALQVVASRLVGQLTQRRRGENELRDGLRRWDQAFTALRRRRAKELRDARHER